MAGSGRRRRRPVKGGQHGQIAKPQHVFELELDRSTNLFKSTRPNVDALGVLAEYLQRVRP
jgi:hypothetical protein